MGAHGHVAVLAGGLSFERDVSLRSGGRARDALRGMGVEAELLDPGADLLAALHQGRFDAAVVMLHGAAGEDGGLRTLLDLAGVPTVGTPAEACAAAWHKGVARHALAQAGIAVAPGVALKEELVRAGGRRLVELLARRFGPELVVKPARSGSGLGAAIARDPDELATALVAALSYDAVVLVEQRLIGTEIAVTLLDRGDGMHALPPVGIHPGPGLFDYAARYTTGATRYDVPAGLDPAVLAEVAAVSCRAAGALGLRDLARVDGIVTASGELVVLEVNTAPGLTEHSLVPMALGAAGLSLGDVLHQAVLRAISSPR